MSAESAQDWRPGASTATLLQRARALAAARNFFARRGIVEVDTPALSHAPVTDPQVASVPVRLPSRPGQPLFLHSSPEFYLKRLLAAGMPDCYQLSRVYRDGECGRLHQPEFTLAEWYRHGLDLDRMAAETGAFLQALLAAVAEPPALLAPLRYRDAFRAKLGLDPLTAGARELAECSKARLGPGCPDLGTDRDAWLDLLLTHEVAPGLGRGGLQALTHYPASQAALARLDPADQRVAERFEIFWQGVELANGYRELTDAGEQRARMQADRERRKAMGLPDAVPDEQLLAALAAGLPECSGVAVGFDRALMLGLGLDSLDQVCSFSL